MEKRGLLNIVIFGGMENNNNNEKLKKLQGSFWMNLLTRVIHGSYIVLCLS